MPARLPPAISRAPKAPAVPSWHHFFVPAKEAAPALAPATMMLKLQKQAVAAKAASRVSYQGHDTRGQAQSACSSL